MIHVPEQFLGKVLLRADFRAFYAMELAWDRPLGAVLGESVTSSATDLYRLTWCLAATWRRDRPRLGFERFLEKLPVDLGALGVVGLSLISEALTPVTPVHETEGPAKPPERVRWTQLAFEGRHILVQSEEEWWRSTFRTQAALLWEFARHHDPDGKSGRPMAEWEIEAQTNRNMEQLMGISWA